MAPLEELDDTTRRTRKVGTGPICCVIVRSLLQTLRVYIYTLVLTRLLVDHDYNIYCLKLTPWHHVRLVSIINSSPSLYPIHVIMHSRMLSAFTCGTILLPNDDALPTADASTANALRKTFYRMVLFCQIRLTCQSLPCTNFWC
jgi:hypothetical protein